MQLQTTKPTTKVLPSFESLNFNMKDLRVIERDKKGTLVELHGRPFIADQRFMSSLYSRYGFGKTVFNLFTIEEVFGRIVDSRPDIDLKVVAKFKDGAEGYDRLLASSSPNVNNLSIEEIVDTFNRFNCVSVTYNDGVVRGRFIPDSGLRTQFIGPDEFQNRYALDIPVDGFGSTKTYLEMLRLVCMNGAVAASKAFTAFVKMGKDPLVSLQRVLGTFDDSQGFARVQRKIESLQKSKLSMNEYSKFLTSISKSLVNPEDALSDAVVPEDLMASIQTLTGDPVRIYHASPSSISSKKQSMLPMSCSVYDIFNLSTEIESHYELPRRIHLREFITKTIEVEPDLENTIKKVPDGMPKFYLPTTNLLYQAN